MELSFNDNSGRLLHLFSLVAFFNITMNFHMVFDIYRTNISLHKSPQSVTASSFLTKILEVLNQ